MDAIHKKTKSKNMKNLKTHVSKELEIGRAGEYFAVFELISNGYPAFLTDQGLAYDIAVDVGGVILKGQVKSTMGLNDHGKTKSVYRFGTRRAKKGARFALVEDCDFYAFVAIKDKKIAFMLSSEIESSKNKGTIKQTIDLGSKDVINFNKKKNNGECRKSTRMFIESFSSFSRMLNAERKLINIK